MENTTLLLLLTLIPGIGPARIKALSAHLQNLHDVLQAEVDGLMQVPGIGEPLARQIYDFLHHTETRQKAIQAAEEQIHQAERYRAKLITILDSDYPPLLKQIYDPPPCLFVRGELPSASTPGLAVVGTRNASEYGTKCTALFCRELASYGIVVYSGLAFGIDMAAHRATLENGGTTVAVLASGVEQIYTDPNGKLWPKIIEHGALISEEWIGSELVPAKFPKRNRIISGISAGTLVVESDLKGGALITAAAALEQNREVFALPGNIFSRTSRGTNKLIQEGQAKAVMSVDDILVELGKNFIKKSSRPSQEVRQPLTPLSPSELSILERMGREAVHIDTLAAVTGIDLSSLLVHLFELELKGAVQQQPGQLFLNRYHAL